MTSDILKLILFVLTIHRSAANNSVRARYYPRFHLAPPHGWMNDPNGFSIFNKEYHLFYQYNPETSQEPGIAHWGHAKSPDLFHWEHLPIAMYPDESYDRQGVFSGSALIEDNKMYLYYTGNLKNPALEYQVLAESADGVNVTKYSNNPIIYAPEYQPNIRDPKVWKHHDTYYMVLGNSFDNNTLGRVLLYKSKNKVQWYQASVLDESDGHLGFMWECPDFFELGGFYVLLFSPQGVKPEGDKYRNLYQTGYIVGDFDYETSLFTPITEFRELDHGHDFYATQTVLDDSGRRLMVAWFDMWEEVYPERDDGFTGFMTIPRELFLGPNGRIIQKPVKEISVAVGHNLFSGKGAAGMVVELEDKAGEIKVTAPRNKDLEVFIESDNQTIVINYDYIKGKVTLNRGGADGIRRTKWRPHGCLIWRIFVDASSVELFCGEGEVTFSSRFFPSSPIKVRLGDISQADELTVNSMQRTVTVPEN